MMTDHQLRSNTKTTMQNEYELMNQLSNSEHVAKVYELSLFTYGDYTYQVLIMDLLGPSLNAVFDSKKTTLDRI